MENHSACFRLSFPSTLQGVAYGRRDVDAYRIFFRWLFGWRIPVREVQGNGIIGETLSMLLCVELP